MTSREKPDNARASSDSNSEVVAPPPPIRHSQLDPTGHDNASDLPLPSLFGVFCGLWMLTWRAKLGWRRLPLVILAAALVPMLAYLTVDSGRVQPFYRWMIDFYFTLLLPLYCLSVCGGMIREEVNADTLGFLLVRPVSRARLFVTKYVCHVLWLQILGLVSIVLLFGVGFIREIPELWNAWTVLLVTQLLAIVAYGALSAFLGLLHQRYMVLGIIYGFVVEMGIGRIPTNINNLSLSRHFRNLLASSDTLAELYNWTSEKTWLSIVIPISVSVIFVTCGAVLFSLREFHHAEEMQK